MDNVLAILSLSLFPPPLSFSLSFFLFFLSLSGKIVVFFVADTWCPQITRNNFNVLVQAKNRDAWIQVRTKYLSTYVRT